MKVCACTIPPSPCCCSILVLLIKKSLVASERRKANVRQRLVDWLANRLPAMREQPWRPVFIDETSVKTNMTRLCGRAPRGARLEMEAPFGAWGTQTFIAGLTHDEMIAPWIIKGTMDESAFVAYVREVLVPELEPGTVVICDNLLPPTKTPRPRTPCERLAAGSCICLPIRQI